MRLTLLGHACWLFETGGGRLLTDPVLTDPFEDGTVTACPARKVDLEALPPLDAVFLSHRHPDHFHPESLARLDRRLPLFLPQDPMMAAALDRLGFSDLRPLVPWQPQRLGGLTLVPTPTAGDFPEVGLLLDDGSGTVFDQVDTPVNTDTIARLRGLAGPLDVHLAMYASQAFGWFDGVPEDLATTHGRNLEAARRLAARVVVPAAAGFRFVDELDWLNRQLFPITQERFVRDLARVAPELRVQPLLPGDTLEVGGGRVHHLPAHARYVSALEPDMARIRPDRAAPVPPVCDDDPAGRGEAALRRGVAALVEQGLVPAVRAAWDQDPLLRALRADRARYHLQAVLPGGDSLDWTLDLSTPALEVRPIAPRLGAELTRTVAASALLEVAEGERSCFHLRVRSRRTQALLSLEPGPQGMAVDQPNVPDLLAWFLVRHRAGAAGQDGLLRYYGLI